MTGKTWTAHEEAELKALVEANLNIDEIAFKLKKTPKAVITKSQRLGLQLQTEGYVNTSISLSRNLPGMEETARILAGALRACVKPGLNKLEVQRLQTVANISKAYKEHIVDFAHYRDVEKKLEKAVEQNAKLQKTLEEILARSPNPPTQPVSGNME